MKTIRVDIIRLIKIINVKYRLHNVSNVCLPLRDSAAVIINCRIFEVSGKMDLTNPNKNPAIILYHHSLESADVAKYV